MENVMRAVRLYNDAPTDIEESDANALIDTGAMSLCIPDHVASSLATGFGGAMLDVNGDTK